MKWSELKPHWMCEEESGTLEDDGFVSFIPEDGEGNVITQSNEHGVGWYIVTSIQIVLDCDSDDKWFLLNFDEIDDPIRVDIENDIDSTDLPVSVFRRV